MLLISKMSKNNSKSKKCRNNFSEIKKKRDEKVKLYLRTEKKMQNTKSENVERKMKTNGEI